MLNVLLVVLTLDPRINHEIRDLTKEAGWSKLPTANVPLQALKDRVQRMIYTSCWVTCGILWDNAIWLTNNLIFNDSFQKICFDIRFLSKLHANMINEARRHRKWENRSPGWAKVTPSGPKVSQRAPKVNQKWATWRQKDAESEPRGRPKYIKKPTFGKGCEKGAKMVPPSYTFWCRFGSHFHEKSMKKVDAKIDAEKVMSIDEKSMRKWS